MSVETLLVGLAMGITLTGLAVRHAMRRAPRRTSSNGAWNYGDTTGDAGSFTSYSGSDGGSRADDCSSSSGSGGWDSGGCDAGGGDGGGGGD